MSRFDRPDFDRLDLLKPKDGVPTARLLFDWWCDDEDRERLLDSLGGQVLFMPSRSPVEDDPAPPRSQRAKQGNTNVALITDPSDVDTALCDSTLYSNIPYAELGGAGFMLAIDPGVGLDGIDWHQEQRAVADALLAPYARFHLDRAAEWAVEQAAILSLARPVFDLAEFAEQAALRYFGLVFGFAAGDHVLLEDAARRGYRALQYLIVGRHFVSEPGTMAAAQQALGRLATRTGALIDEYADLKRAPRKGYRPGKSPANAGWPVGVQPWSEMHLSSLGEPALKQLPDVAGPLGGQDLGNLVVGLLVGMVGNVQTGVCLMLQHLLQHQVELKSLRDLAGLEKLERANGEFTASLMQRQAAIANTMAGLLARYPPVPFLPRRTLKAAQVKGGPIKAGTDCILALRRSIDLGCPWGAGSKGKAPHSCLGRGFAEPLLAALLKRVASLPDLDQLVDGVTGEVLKPERLWGFGCTRYRLRYRRDRQRVQQPLIVIMPVKAPIAENAERLRAVIRSGAPRIQWLLDDSGIVHVAWFEFMERDTLLALRTVYDGDFDSYIRRFAEHAGEVFDQLFVHIEGGPPLPVAEHPNEFIETIRAYNRVPLADYFYSAYPDKKVGMISGRVGAGS